MCQQTPLMCHHATAIFGDNVRRMEAWDDTSRPTGAFFFCSLLYSLLILSQDGRHIFTRPPLPPQPPPTTIIMTRGSSPLVLSHFNPHSHHHIDVSTHNCRFRRQCMTNWGSRRVYVSSTGFYFLCVFTKKKSKIDYAYYNDTGRNGGREWERGRERSRQMHHTLAPGPGSCYASVNI